MSISINAKFRNARSRITLKESNTVAELKLEIKKSLNIEENEQRIVLDWREVTDDCQKLSEAGFAKNSKVLVLKKKEPKENSDSNVVVTIEFEKEKFQYTINREQEFSDLVVMFFENHDLKTKLDSVKLKVKSRTIKLDQEINEYLEYLTAPIQLMIVPSTPKRSKVMDVAQLTTPAKTDGVADLSEESGISTPKEVNSETVVTTTAIEEVLTPKKKRSKEEKITKKEKTPKKEKVQSMNIMSFLRQSRPVDMLVPSLASPRPLVTPPLPEVVTKSSQAEVKQSIVQQPQKRDERPSEVLQALLATTRPSLDCLVADMKQWMASQRNLSLDRTRQLHERGASIVISREDKTETVEKRVSTEKEREAPPADDVAVIDVLNEVDTDGVMVDATPQLFTTTVETMRHTLVTIDKTSLSPEEFLHLSRMLGFRYIHPDTDTPLSGILFGISHAFSNIVTGRSPFAEESRVDYATDSEEEEIGEEEEAGDDCNDTESDDSMPEAVNQLDFDDGFLEEEDLNIGDASLTAEEKSALVFRSISGNKGKLGKQVPMENQPFIVSSREGVVMGVDLRQCTGIIGDPVFFSTAVDTIRKCRLEEICDKTDDSVADGGVSENAKCDERRGKVSAKKLRMNDDMVKVLTDLIQGQTITITQIDDKMQELYPGLPKRQIESKLHELADKKKKVWVLRADDATSRVLGDSFQERILNECVSMEDIAVVNNSSVLAENISRKRIYSVPDNLDDIVEIINTNSSFTGKKIRIQPEKIPDGTILHGNISQSAFASEFNEGGPSTFDSLL